MISVIMPVYNAESYLLPAINSILQQTEPDLELIIVNDGSTDRSEEIIRSCRDPRIVYVKQPNQGEAAARNRGLEEARGEWIAWQDADDISLPHRLQMLRRAFTSERIGFVHSDMLLIDERDRPIGYWQSRSMAPQRLLRFLIKVGTPFNNPSMMVRREALGDLRYNRDFKVGTDTDMVARFAPDWESVHIQEPLVLYRRHAQNLSNSKDYQVLHGHMQHLLAGTPLTELFPELEWDNPLLPDTEARAQAILALFLARRGMNLDCQQWYDKAMQGMKTPDNTRFVIAVGNMINGDFANAIRFFRQCDPLDPVALNYLGECWAIAGEEEEARACFLQSLRIAPHYFEPLENLKAVVSLKGFELRDARWQAFASARGR